MTPTLAMTSLPTVSLAELSTAHALHLRSDRKYVVDAGTLPLLLDALAGEVAVLEIAGSTSFRYSSVYFDTPDFISYLGAARRRSDRFKVRTRTYHDQGTTWIEAKQRTRRGQNDKSRRSHDPGRPACITPEAFAFLSNIERIRPHVPALMPVVRTQYVRTTFRIADQRVTVDSDLRVDDLHGTAVGIGNHLIIETKSPGRPGVADRALWRLGHRPTTISKYALGVASFRPDLPRHRWHRTIDRWSAAIPQ